MQREVQGDMQRAQRGLSSAGEFPFISNMHLRQLQDPSVRAVQVTLSQAPPGPAQPAGGGGVLSMAQTRLRDWPSRTERDEPFSRAVGAEEKAIEDQSNKEIKRK